MPKQTTAQLNARITRSGDIIGLHYLPDVDTRAGIAMVLDAGLIPELKGPTETAKGRAFYPQALLAQSVNAKELLAAVEAGADVLVAGQMLDQKEISAAHIAAGKKGKSVSVIVEIDPAVANVEEQIHLAVENGADGIKFKPAGKAEPKTMACLELAKTAYPELLLLVAGGVKQHNRHHFAAKAGMGADTLADIKAVTPWAKKSVTYNTEIASAMQHTVHSCSSLINKVKQTKLAELHRSYTSDLMTEEKYMETIRAFIKEIIQERKTWKGLFQAKNGKTNTSKEFYNSLTPAARNVVAEALHGKSFPSLQDFRDAALALIPAVAKRDSDVELSQLAGVKATR